ncbi:hypothetical protein [Haloprofundus sp. MHR1]|uniref:hypothetical protein n=1 Tax=Haloprofundus sp. MHR1 TaxID=2572921 RepID=UPI0010BE4BAD|nr:hypothetical protein [Haloprofundus sp. MHR1]QCJ46388.1 hypothetical protein FCF25_04305 [Haloprofundus sp. MHR1]
MNFRDDRRAVTVQVGFVLLFGVLILSLSMYQVQVVPADNERVEFDHNQRVQSDLLDARNAILRSAGTGTTHPVSVSLGAQYPNRVLFVNPPPASGRLSTTESVADGIVIENARAVDAETADYWTGDDVRTFETRSLEYTPDYAQYQNPPTTVYENSVVYNRFDDGAALPQSDQTLVDGRRISLVALGGELSRERTGVEPLDVRSVSASARTTTVTSDGEPIRISLATELSEEKWQELLEGEEYVADVTVEGGVLTMTLEADETYSLRTAKVGVGSNVGETEAAYVTDVEGDGSTVRAGTTRTLVAEVRDGFGNPVIGEDVTAEVTDGGGSVTFPEGAKTDGEGQVRVVYEPPEGSSQSESVEVEVGFGDADTEAERATFDLTVSGTASGGDGDGGNGGTAASDVRYNDDAEPFSGSSTVRFSVSNDGPGPAVVEAITVDTAAAGKLRERNGGQGAGQHEMHLETDDSGYYEAGDGGNSRYTLGDRVTLIRRATAESGSDITFSLLRFYESGSGNSGDSVDMQNERLTVTLYFADGSAKSMTFTVGSF